MSNLMSISPIDGRYKSKTKELENYFSEFALMKYRVRIEVEYFISLCELKLPQLKRIHESTSRDIFYSRMRNFYLLFSIKDANRIKEIEKITNHDVKAIEYFVKEKLEYVGLEAQKEFVHFGLTSQDINNTSIPLLVKEFLMDIYYPLLNSVVSSLKKLSNDYSDVSMLSRTHGQPASPTKLGKEFNVYVERLENQIDLMKRIPHGAKFGGAVGNFNAHYVAYPEIDWILFANYFVNNTLGLKRSQYTTQIEHYDYFAALCDNLKRINSILIDFNRDIWSYISMDYFKQKIQDNEVGSSAMPHKVNPIDFENSEGNLGVANSLLEHFSSKLPISRMQRDLTDSTVLRNIGTSFGHILISMKSLVKGIDKLVINELKINSDLEDNWIVISEAIQTILRREGYTNPYEVLKELTRTNTKVTQKIIHDFIDRLDVSFDIKTELKKITPYNYTGIQLLQ